MLLDMSLLELSDLGEVGHYPSSFEAMLEPRLLNVSLELNAKIEVYDRPRLKEFLGILGYLAGLCLLD